MNLIFAHCVALPALRLTLSTELQQRLSGAVAASVILDTVTSVTAARLVFGFLGS